MGSIALLVMANRVEKNRETESRPLTILSITIDLHGGHTFASLARGADDRGLHRAGHKPRVAFPLPVGIGALSCALRCILHHHKGSSEGKVCIASLSARKDGQGGTSGWTYHVEIKLLYIMTATDVMHWGTHPYWGISPYTAGSPPPLNSAS